jgi:hypothetical protein
MIVAGEILCRLSRDPEKDEKKEKKRMYSSKE